VPPAEAGGTSICQEAGVGQGLHLGLEREQALSIVFSGSGAQLGLCDRPSPGLERLVSGRKLEVHG
jgi:hypothetical protein